MTPKDWIKIVVGMLGVFLVGMFVVSAVNAGKRKVGEITTTASTLSIPMLGAPFRLHDAKLGSLQKLQVERSAPDHIEAFKLTVRLADSIDVDQFAGCELTVTDAHQIDNKMGFACLTEADSGFADLVQFGTITFQPSGQVHRLMLPSSVAEDLRNGSGGNSKDGVSRHDSGGNVNIKINGQQIVDIQGSDSGGRIQIRDPKTGKLIVDIQGGENGSTVKIDGKTPAKGTVTGH
jgi:hypothetical protein